MVKVNVINKSRHQLPSYESQSAAGMDLRANIDQDIVIEPFERVLIPTGIFMELPIGYEAQVRSRSGLAWKHGVMVLNSPGTVDADYRGEVGVVLMNLSKETFTVKDGDRIAQMVIAKHESAVWEEVSTLNDTDRGAGGYGSTGKK